MGIIRKIFIVTLALTILVANTGYGLATLPASQNVTAKREIFSSLEKNLVRFAETEDDKKLLADNNAECLLLSSGHLLISRDLPDNDVDFLQAVTREKIKAIMQILLWKYKNGVDNKFTGIKDLVLKNLPVKDISGPQADQYTINTIALSVSWISLLDNGLILSEDLPENVRPFLDKIRPAIDSHRRDLFTREFWKIDVRDKMIKKACDNGMRFYNIELFPEKNAKSDVKSLLRDLETYSFTEKPRTPLPYASAEMVKQIQNALYNIGPAAVDPLIKELHRLYTNIDHETIKTHNYKYTRKAIIGVLTGTNKRAMTKLYALFVRLKKEIPSHRFFDDLLMIGNSDSPYVEYFIPFYKKCLENQVSTEGVIFRTDDRVDPIISILDKCGDPSGFLRKLRICADNYVDTDNSAVFAISIKPNGRLKTSTFPGIVLHQGGRVENYRGTAVLKASDDMFRGTIHGSTKSSDGFLRLDPPSGELRDNEVEELVRILRILLREIHPQKHLILLNQTIEKIEDHYNITLPEDLTILNTVIAIDNRFSTPAIKKHHKRVPVKISPLIKTDGNKVQAAITITNPKGLHVKGATAIATFMQRFPKTNATIHDGDKTADTRDVLDMQACGFGAGDTIEITAEGPRAEEVVTLLIGTINNADQNKKLFKEEFPEFPTTAKGRKLLKKFINDHPEILDMEILNYLSDRLIEKITTHKWPWHKSSGYNNTKNTSYFINFKLDHTKNLSPQVQNYIARPSLILQDFLDLHDNQYCKAPEHIWHNTVKKIVTDFLRANIQVSSENMTVFGICMSSENHTPIKFSSKPSRFMVKEANIIQRMRSERVYVDGFIPVEPHIIRGSLYHDLENPEGFIRLDASYYNDPPFLTDQIMKIADFLVEIGVNPDKELVFPEKTRIAIDKTLNITLPEEFTLGEFRDLVRTKNYVTSEKKRDAKALSAIFGLPLRKEIKIVIPKGIHAKTAIHIVEIAKAFPTAKIYIRKGNKVADAKNRVELMRLGVGQDELIDILAVGPGAQTATEKIAEFVKTGKTAKKNEIMKDLPAIFNKWHEAGVKTFRDLRLTHDIKSTKVLFVDLLRDQLKSDREYDIHYDVSRLSPDQVELVKTYAEVLRKRSRSDRTIRLKPFSSGRSSGNENQPLFSVTCRSGEKSIGEGNIFVAPETGELKDYIIRIPGLLNIAFAASNIEKGLTGKELEEKYGPLIGFIKTQCILILGEEHFSDNIISDINNIRLILPKIYKHDYTEPIKEYNRETRQTLIRA